MNKLLALILCLTFISCSSVTPSQRKDINQWKEEKVYKEVKSPSKAGWLNILPGIGNFYVGEVGYGILNLLSWPFSITWSIYGASEGAYVRNWEETRESLLTNRQRKARKKKHSTDIEAEME